MTLWLYRIGRTCVRRRRLVFVAWVLAAIAAVVVGQASGGKMSDAFEIEGTEAQHAYDVLEEDFPEAAGTSAQLVFAAEGGTLSGQPAVEAVDAALADVADQPHVGTVGELQLSADKTIGHVDVQYDQPSSEIRSEAFERLEAAAEETNRSGAVRMELGGDLPSEAVQDEPGGQEAIGLLVAVVVLLVAFGSVIAMGLPIGLALLGLLASTGLITLVASVTDVNSFAPTLAAMIGLGVGIDYALFIVTRHRENLRQGMTVEESAGRAVATSGSAVLFAGTTVVIAICGLAIAGIHMVTIMGLMSGLTVAMMVAVSLTLLPALLGMAGHKIDRVRVWGRRSNPDASGNGHPRETIWHRWGRQVSAHPWRYLLGGAAVLAVTTAPLASLRLGMFDNGTSPESLTTRRAYDLVAEGFGRGFNGPLMLSVDLNGASVDDLGELKRALAEDPGIDGVAPIQANAEDTSAVLRLIPKTAPQDEKTSDLIHHLRDDVIPAALEDVSPEPEVFVGGQTATFIDMTEKVESRLLWFIGAVLLLSLLLLTVVFRSILIPLKAALMNLLSIGASYGVIVAIFQWGWLKSVFGVEETVPIVSFMPMMLFAVLFGLSMDYEVFLLSRVREEYLERRDNDRAVVEGLSATARVITSAALIMISVFGAFALSDDPMAKMFGIGLATAVLIDATIVRIVLVPATMRLLGDRNWWLPGWLDRILPRLDVEGATGLPEPEYESRPEPVPVMASAASRSHLYKETPLRL